MLVEQCSWRTREGWRTGAPRGSATRSLVLAFGSREVLAEAGWMADVRQAWPLGEVVGCSTAGEIADTQVLDGSVVVTAVAFERTEFRIADVAVHGAGESYEAGRQLATALCGPGLVHVLVLSDGLHVNGSALVAGLADGLPAGVGTSGGLSGDGDRFAETRVMSRGMLRDQSVVAVGLYSSALRVGCASLGGWDPFGPERLVTRSEGNVLYEMDGRPCLELYKTYLGEHASGLPATALLFPLSVRTAPDERPVVRTVLAVDETAGSMTFAGDIPQGAYARLMRANFDRLIDGAADAARTSHQPLGEHLPELALLISCIGRKLVLGQRVEEEVEGVRDVLGPTPVLAGFYSYGEISPFTPDARCELHNQTMTITTLSER